MSAATSPAPRWSEDLKENAQISERLRTYADLLEHQGEDGFRIRAYRRAAHQIDSLGQSLRTIHAQGGADALIALPVIGRGIASAIVEILTTGRWSQLERIKGESQPELLFMTLPGVGKVLADRFASLLDAQTLEELEVALRNPRMGVPGLGPRRRLAILASLADRLEPIRRARRSSDHSDRRRPPVSLLLEADAIYRQKAATGSLRVIAPKRHNPEGRAWLPILHLRRGEWHLTLLFSNTARAHEFGKTTDWVVIFFHHANEPEAQCTVVTQHGGALVDKRVVRGREEECAEYYESAHKGDRNIPEHLLDQDKP